MVLGWAPALPVFKATRYWRSVWSCGVGEYLGPSHGPFGDCCGCRAVANDMRSVSGGRGYRSALPDEPPITNGCEALGVAEAFNISAEKSPEESRSVHPEATSLWPIAAARVRDQERFRDRVDSQWRDHRASSRGSSSRGCPSSQRGGARGAVLPSATASGRA